MNQNKIIPDDIPRMQCIAMVSFGLLMTSVCHSSCHSSSDVIKDFVEQTKGPSVIFSEVSDLIPDNTLDIFAFIWLKAIN